MADVNPRETHSVDLALVLAVDCSSSIDAADFHLQMRGISEAISNPAVFTAIQSGPHQRIALSIVHWSNHKTQKIALPWRALGSRSELEMCAEDIAKLPRNWVAGGTGLAAGLNFCTAYLNAVPFSTARKTIDVSGDGQDNEGGDMEAMHQQAKMLAITINGLPIIDGSRLLEAYYRERVIVGTDAFVVPAADIRAFTQAMTQKLLQEIQRQVT